MFYQNLSRISIISISKSSRFCFFSFFFFFSFVSISLSPQLSIVHSPSYLRTAWLPSTLFSYESRSSREGGLPWHHVSTILSRVEVSQRRDDKSYLCLRSSFFFLPFFFFNFFFSFLYIHVFFNFCLSSSISVSFEVHIYIGCEHHSNVMVPYNTIIFMMYETVGVIRRCIVDDSSL